MTTSLRRPARWSKKTDALVRHIAIGCRPALQSELGHWLESSARFTAFITTHQDKVRKKLSTSDEESRLDVRSELRVAYLILADRRFELAFEAYGAHRRGPDLTVTFRTNQRFNLEVTRLRATSDVANEDAGAAVARLANVVCGKLRQLPGDVPNALVITARGLIVSEESLAAAMRLLKVHADQKDDAFFARRGLKTARDFYAQYLHLGGIFGLDEAAAPPGAVFAPNREVGFDGGAAARPRANRPLVREAIAALTADLSDVTSP